MDKRSFFGNLLMTVGALAAILAGGCSLFFLSDAFLGGGNIFNKLDYIMLILIVGGPPVVIGILLFLAGKHLVQKATAAQDNDEDVV